MTPSTTTNNNNKVGLLIVGLGGANGTTLLAGVLANRRNVEWRGSKGEKMTPNYYGCITQLNQRGVYGGVGYKDKIQSGLADANNAAIGGWVRERRALSRIWKRLVSSFSYFLSFTLLIFSSVGHPTDETG